MRMKHKKAPIGALPCTLFSPHNIIKARLNFRVSAFVVAKVSFKGRNLLKLDKELLIKQHNKDIAFTINNSLSKATIDRLAKQARFQQRNRKVPASCFVNTLLFSEYNQSHTSLPDLTADLNQVHGIDISKEAMHKKFTVEAVSFLKSLLTTMLSEQLKLRTPTSLSQHFPCIKIKDSTKFSLPSSYNNEYRGYGNFSKKNGLMSLQYEYDLISGNWLSIELTKGLRNDQQDSKETIDTITADDLYIRDLGYITPTYLSAIVEKKAFFLNRLPAPAGVYSAQMKPLDWKKIDSQLKKANAATLELDVLLYERNQIPCRLIIERVSDKEYHRRIEKAKTIAKSKEIGISALHKTKLKYNAFVTNVDNNVLPIGAIRKTYYLRWQIELIFKTWKSFFEINKMKKVKKERMECQLLAKLLWILINWRLFKTCNTHVRKIDAEKGVSVLIFFKRCLKFSATLRLVFLKKLPVVKWLRDIYLPLIANSLCDAPRNKETHYQSLRVNYKALS